MMTEMEIRTCPSCEHGSLIALTGKGRFFPNRVFGELEMPEDVALPMCDHCGKMILNPQVAIAFDEGMSRAYQSRLSQIISESLSVLNPEIMTQQDLEHTLGLSRGYISKLKGGKESSAPVAILLGILASNPQARLKDIQEIKNAQSSRINARSASSATQVVSITQMSAESRNRTVKKIPSGRAFVLAKVGT